MKKSRRDFIKHTGLVGLGLASSDYAKAYTPYGKKSKKSDAEISEYFTQKPHTQKFNMSGFAAPKIDIVRIGFIGTGSRGGGLLKDLSRIEGLEIKALCDLVTERANAAKKRIENSGQEPDIYAGSEDIWEKVCEREDIDLIYIATPWALHTPMALYSMEHGKHVVIEVPAAQTVDECWQLVETSENTKKHCMMLSNTCYDTDELLTLNMARKGFFGEITHCDCAYIHDLNEAHPVLWSSGARNWRYEETAKRTGNLYPTHGLAPVCRILNINRGDKMDFMVSLSSADFTLGEKTKLMASKYDYYKSFIGKPFNGNMNTSIIRTSKGRSIMLQYDITSARAYTRIHMISGTKASYLRWPFPPRIAIKGGWISDEEYKTLAEKYTPPIVKMINEMDKYLGQSRAGIDFMMSWRLIDCLRNGLPLDMDVYDAASWSSIGPLSEWSVANGSNSIKIPDFTCGSYVNNLPHDISISKGGNTGVRIIPGKSIERDFDH